MAKNEHKQASLNGSLEIEEPVPPYEEVNEYGKNNRLLDDWLDKSFRNEYTKKGYRVAVFHFLRTIYPDDAKMEIPEGTFQLTKAELLEKVKNRRNKINYFLDRYIAENERVFLDDYKACILQLSREEYAPGTIIINANKIRKFFDRLDPKKYGIEKREMDDIRSGLLPQSITITKDEIPTKDELKTILTYLSVKNKAIFLFLISTGVRISAALKMKIIDLNLDVDPPETILPISTTTKKNPPKVWFTYETRDAILAWLKIKDTYLKKSGDYFDKKLVFGVKYGTTKGSWNKALKKAGLDQRDPNTKRRIRKYHIHTLRKFFRTQMGEAGMPDLQVHALMGHKAYLSEAYDRPRKLAESYKKYMHAVTIFEKDLETEMRDKLAKGEAKIEELQGEKKETKMTLSIIAMNLDISDPHELESESLLIQINNAIAKMKKTLDANVEEIAYLKETGRGPQ